MLAWASNLLETDCLLLHLVFQEANPLRQRGGFDLGVNQELHAICDLLFPHVRVLGQCWPHLSPSTTAVLRAVGVGGVFLFSWFRTVSPNPERTSKM